MSVVAQVAVVLNSVVLLCVAPLEMVFYERPWARRFLHVDTQNVQDVRLWAFVVGFRNALSAVGALAGLVILHAGDEQVGRTVVIVALWYMLLASLAMGLADLLGFWRPRGGSVMGTAASSVLPALALVVA